MRALLFALVTIGLLAPATPGVGEEVYFSVRLRDLAITEGSLPANAAMPRRMGQSAAAMYPWVTLDGPGDAYVWLQQAAWNWINPANMADTGSLVIQVPEKKDVAGYLIFPNADRSAMLRLRFTVPASAASGPARAAFFQGKREHYQRLLAAGAPGAAWFRHEAHQADRALASSSTEVAQAPPRIFPGNWDVNRTYELFTGGRALSENLQLDRELPPGQANENRTVLSSIRGITVQEIDWKPLLKDAKPKLDRLADKVPADQHVVFFPSFAAAMALTGAAKENDTPVLRWAQPRSENAHLAERYQAQLCLPVSDLARLLGPHVVRSVAVTGSDPYFPTGTDVAVLFETPQPAVLEKLLLGRITMDAAKTKGAEPSRGDAHGLAFRAFRSPDRRVSSYLAQLDGAVVVANSPYQLERLSDVAKGESPSIAALAEYQFFRTRYRLGDPEETALVFLSDPTIRRWCGPKWRIAASRRLRAAAVLSELQAGGMDALVAKTAQGGPIYTDLPLADGGTLALASGGVVSSTYGSIAFLTPIAELPLTEVTQAEATAYERWRDGYQQNWSWAFDPIALRLSLAKDKVGADLTVMPLIANTQYRELIEFSRGVQIPADAGDRHGALAHAVLAINRQSPRFHSAENMFSMMSEGLSLGWLGRCVSIYADDDPFWSELAATEEKDIPKFFENNLGRLPLGLAIDVESGLKMAAFLVAARAFIEQTAPGQVQWESLTHKEHPYVRIKPARGAAMPREAANLAIYYTTTGDLWTITLNEKMLQRAIDRHFARQEAVKEGKPLAAPGRPWLGTNVGLQVDRKAVDVASAAARSEYLHAMQARAWDNLPILNQWKHRYGDRDPVAVHKEVWGVELVCPGGGQYVWNPTWRTMESTVYGHPGEPKIGPPLPAVLAAFATANFGLTFEDQGLRAQVTLHKDRQPPAKEPSGSKKSNK